MRALAIAILLALAPAARADSVDWNQYVEKPGATYTPMGANKPAARETKPAEAKPAKKQVAQKTKAKGKTKARRKK